MRERLLQALGTLLITVPGILLVTVFLVPFRGPKECLEMFRGEHPEMARTSGIVSRVWTRTQGERWVSALLVQPGDITREQLTIVCYFARTNYVPDRVEVFDGDRVGALKHVSMSNLDPRTWLK
jgi:hypothetical protein